MVDPSSHRAFSLDSHTFASASEIAGLPAKTAGRSNGVRVALDQMPSKSGCPSAARGMAPVLDTAAGALALCPERHATANKEMALYFTKLGNFIGLFSVAD